MAEDEVPSEPIEPPERAPEPAPEPAAEATPEPAPVVLPDATPTDIAGVAPADPPPPEHNSRRMWIILGAAAAVIVVAVVGALVLSRHGSSSKTPASTLEPAASAGENPFTDSVAVGATTFPTDVQAAITKQRARLTRSKKTDTLVATGTAPGLYAGKGTTRVCNSQALVSYLDKNPGNATAWAKASGISRTNLATFVTALTPVVLTSDTRVTNHAYDNATISPRQSILQAGTPVLIDATGMPRVACKSGNPLSATRPIVITKTRGDAWTGFSAKNVVTIVPGPATRAFTLLDAQTGKLYPQPIGNAAPSDTAQWVVAEPNFVGTTVKSTTILEISLYSPWVKLAEIPGEGVRGLAWGAGKWVAVSNASVGGGNHVLVSTDLHTWKQVAAIPDRLSAIAYGDGRWTATALHLAPAADSTETYRAERVIYSSTDTVHWKQVAVVGDVSKHSPWPIGRGPVAYGPVAFGNGEWLTAAASGDDASGKGIPPAALFTSKDGQHWTANGKRFTGEISTALAYNSGTWALGSVPAAAGSAAVSTSTNGTTWTSSSTGLHRGGVAAIGAGTGGWFAVIVTASSAGPESTFLKSTDAKTWTTIGNVHAFVWALAFGGGPSTSGTTATTTTPVAGAASSTPTTVATVTTKSGPVTPN